MAPDATPKRGEWEGAGELYWSGGESLGDDGSTLCASEADIAGQNQHKMGGEAGCRGQAVRAKTPGVTPTCRVNATLNALAEA
jgi:hypothetical protein